tara:strand:- start:597 stop:719 length:123 start_codon:yes stop_codon:yes gene_type:complete
MMPLDAPIALPVTFKDAALFRYPEGVFLVGVAFSHFIPSA